VSKKDSNCRSQGYNAEARAHEKFLGHVNSKAIEPNSWWDEGYLGEHISKKPCG